MRGKAQNLIYGSTEEPIAPKAKQNRVFSERAEESRRRSGINPNYDIGRAPGSLCGNLYPQEQSQEGSEHLKMSASSAIRSLNSGKNGLPRLVRNKFAASGNIDNRPFQRVKHRILSGN